MLAFTEWLRIRKKKEKKNEQRSSETHRENGNLNQQGKAPRGNPQVAKQTVHLFAVPEL